MTDGWRGLDGRGRVRLAGRVGGSILFRYACFATMVWLSLHAEARPAPRLPDLVIDAIPYQQWVNDWNYWIWLGSYIPIVFVLLVIDPRRFVRFMITGGILSVIRGICILLTGLGPVSGVDLNVERLADPATFRLAFFEIIDPLGVFFRHSAHIYLTKDLFFSGHTATTFLLLLYVWPYRWARWTTLFLHVLVVASLFYGHVHYTIDVVGAYTITFSLWVLREGRSGLGPATS